MSHLAEEIIEEWLNRQGYFAIRAVFLKMHVKRFRHMKNLFFPDLFLFLFDPVAAEESGEVSVRIVY